MRFSRNYVYLLPLLLAAAGCKNPADDKPKATVSDSATGVTTAAETHGKGTVESLVIAANESKVGFVGSKVTGSHEGSFSSASGTIDLVDEKAEKSKVMVSIDTESVKTDNEKLTGHLKSPDFFDTAKFPKATFTSTEIKPGGDKGATHTLTGDLDLHGVKKKISFPATIRVTPDSASTDAEFVINRKDFGIVYAGKADDLIRDEVVIKLSVKAPRKK